MIARDPLAFAFLLLDLDKHPLRLIVIGISVTVDVALFTVLPFGPSHAASWWYPRFWHVLSFFPRHILKMFFAVLRYRPSHLFAPQVKVQMQKPHPR